MSNYCDFLPNSLLDFPPLCDEVVEGRLFTLENKLQEIETHLQSDREQMKLIHTVFQEMYALSLPFNALILTTFMKVRKDSEVGSRLTFHHGANVFALRMQDYTSLLEKV
jgi:hypothetical protein